MNLSSVSGSVTLFITVGLRVDGYIIGMSIAGISQPEALRFHFALDFNDYHRRDNSMLAHLYIVNAVRWF